MSAELVPDAIAACGLPALVRCGACNRKGTGIVSVALLAQPNDARAALGVETAFRLPRGWSWAVHVYNRLGEPFRVQTTAAACSPECSAAIGRTLGAPEGGTVPEGYLDQVFAFTLDEPEEPEPEEDDAQERAVAAAVGP